MHACALAGLIQELVTSINTAAHQLEQRCLQESGGAPAVPGTVSAPQRRARQCAPKDSGDEQGGADIDQPVADVAVAVGEQALY